MSGMRKKRKARGRAARLGREAADALARQAGDGLEIVDGDADAGPDDAGTEADPGADIEADTEANTGAEVEAAGADPDDAGDEVSEGEVLMDLAGDERAADALDGDAGPEDGAADAAEEGDAEAERPAAASLPPAQLKALIEALLFASDKPLTVQRLRQLVRVPDLARVQAIVDEIQADHAERGVVLQEVSGGYLFRTHAAYSAWVQQLIQGRPVRLSRAQLETLAIVAYRQPITRPEIDQIRGVDSGGTLKVLLDRHLVRILGKKEEPGRPLLYGTTKEFLDFFSLKDLRELPTLREYSELSEESRQVVEKVTGEPVAAGEAAAVAADAQAAAAETEAQAAAAETEAQAAAAETEAAEAETEAAEEAEAGTAAAPEADADAPRPLEPDPAPAMDAEFAAAQARIDDAVAAVDALGRHPGEVLTDLPVEPEDERVRGAAPADDAAP